MRVCARACRGRGVGGGTPNKTLGCAQAQSPGFHAALWLPDLGDRCLWAAGVLLSSAPALGALFGWAGRAPPPPPPPAPARGVGGVCPFLFFSSAPPLLFPSAGMQSVQLWVRSGSPLIDRFLLRSFLSWD